MKPPPFLLLAALLFWGWQSGLLLYGAIMGLVLESSRFIKARWDLTGEDFRRLWNFSTLLALTLVVYVFTTNEEGGGLNSLLHVSAVVAARNAGVSATTFLRWLPMTMFLFVAAQRFSERGSVPLSAISLLMRLRRKGGSEAERNVDVSYAYFIVCLFSAGIHTNAGTHSYFWGQAVLIAWALWPLRSRRFGLIVWVGALAAAIGLGFSGQHGIGELQRALEGYNAQWMMNLMRQRTDASQAMTAIGRIGKLKLSARIVIRLEPKGGSTPPVYLREASYRGYHPQRRTWQMGGSQNNFADLVHDAGDGSSWTLLPGKTNTSVVNIASYLEGRSQDTGDPEGLLPLPTGSSRLENLPVFPLKMNKTGAVLADGLGLVIFDAHYGPGATFDSPPDAGTNHLDLTVPADEVPALDQIISEMKISGATEERKRVAVQQFFAANFIYSTWLGPDKVARTNETALSRFLLHSRSGHCEYFATATVLLLRELGIPARYAVGYAVHEPAGHGYVVREHDAHAWCLVWNEAKQMWEDFDTTPASWVAKDTKSASALQWFSDFWSWVRFQIAKFRWGQANLRQYILWALIPVLALLLYQIIFRHGRRRRPQAKTGKSASAIFWPGLDSEFYLLERKLAARGVPRQPSEPLSGWLARALANPGLADLRQPLQELLRLHYCHRFDPRGLSGEERETLTREAKICLDMLSRVEQHSASPA
ncbi:MAG: transglutaminase domain-containing protein [Verrucomicrobiia bacterium]